MARTAIATAPPGGFPTPDPRSRFQEDCPVTLPNGRKPPGEPIAQPTHHGVGEMWTALPLNGVLRPSTPGGTFSPRWWFYRPAVGVPIEVTGERLDADAPPLAVDLELAAYTESAQVVGVLTFPTPGCWLVTVRSLEALLTFVVLLREGQ